MYHTSKCINSFVGHFEAMSDEQFKAEEGTSRKDILDMLSSIQGAINQDLEEAEAKKEKEEEAQEETEEG